ncbi:helix-turn-helix domain-containing protein [Phaeobacter sp. LSS9]|uniref:helix-turn-helix domain-containing protein n=1 Tax=unclassified Phaeobacter TaxID=2621772 RepID=UPI0019672D14|nr:helix-turn-helix domain-containing protein [Phaeobacter sp. LSS9]
MAYVKLPPTDPASELAKMSDIAFGEWLNTGHVARLLKISPSSLEKARSLGRGPYAALPYHKIGRLVRYRRTDIESFLSTQRIVGVTRR